MESGRSLGRIGVGNFGFAPAVFPVAPSPTTARHRHRLFFFSSLTFTPEAIAPIADIALAKEMKHSPSQELNRAGAQLVQEATAENVAMHAPPDTFPSPPCLSFFFSRSSPTERATLRQLLVSLTGGAVIVAYHTICPSLKRAATATLQLYEHGPFAAPYVYQLW